MSIAKITGIVGLGGAGLLGMYYLSTAEAVIPKCHFLFEDSDYANKIADNGDYKDKYGATYGKYLVGVETIKDGTTNNNIWWQWSYDNRYLKNNTDLKDKFSKVEKATGDSNSLQSICKDAYKEKLNGTSTSEKIKTSIETKSENDFLESNIWLFCSPAGTKMKSIKEAGEDSNYTSKSNSYGKTKETTLLAIQGNDWFWEFKQEQYDKDNTANKVTMNKSVKEWCKDSYGKDKVNGQQTQSNDPKETDVDKWCSLTEASATQ